MTEQEFAARVIEHEAAFDRMQSAATTAQAEVGELRTRLKAAEQGNRLLLARVEVLTEQRDRNHLQVERCLSDTAGWRASYDRLSGKATRLWWCWQSARRRARAWREEARATGAVVEDLRLRRLAAIRERDEARAEAERLRQVCHAEYQARAVARGEQVDLAARTVVDGTEASRG